MMSDLGTNRPMNEEERVKLLQEIIRERFGEWATRKDEIQSNQETTR
jgi:hypothetical protein